MIAIVATHGEILAWRKASERLKLVDEMRLVEVATGKDGIAPLHCSTRIQSDEYTLKARQARILLGHHPYRLAKHLDQPRLAQPNMLGN